MQTRWLYCGMPTIQYSARSAWLSVRLCKKACPKVTMVKVICHKALRRRTLMVQCYSTGDGNVSFHKGTLVPSGEYDWTCASLGPLASTIETATGLGLAVFAQLTAESAYTSQWAPLSTRILPLPMEDLDLPCNTWCFRPNPSLFPQIDIIGAMAIVWRVREKIIRPLLCNIVCNNCTQCNAHTYEQT